MPDFSSLAPMDRDHRFRALIAAAEVEAIKANGSASASFFAGYLSGIRAGADTFGSLRFDMLEQEAKTVPGDFGSGFRAGLMNIEIALA
ncbi:hypothetical protein [Ensifer sp. B1-9]|uniref:hypothetical protein n=1 Tax=Ensifer sp. B1-9 TaxID=3141455 RepID=UPI003D1AA137